MMLRDHDEMLLRLPGTVEEREWLEKYANGDPEARQVLIERNLRLVAHIINNG